MDLCFDNDDDSCLTESYPFTFKGVWSLNDNRELEIQELSELKFDTSSYEENNRKETNCDKTKRITSRTTYPLRQSPQRSADEVGLEARGTT